MSAPPAPDAAPRSLPALVRALAGRGDATALTVFDRDGRRDWSSAALSGAIAAASARLAADGLAPGEPVLLCGPNGASWVVACLAIACSGGVVVPLDDLSSAATLARVAADCGARRGFLSAVHRDALAAAPDAPPLAATLLDAMAPADAQAAASLPAAEADPDAVAVLLYTSGTTGTPKAVPLTHRNLMSNVAALVAERLAGPDDRVLLPLPLHHAFPFTVGLLGSLANGAALVLPAGVSGPQIIEALKGARATIMIGVPRLYVALLAAIDDRIARAGRWARLLLGLSTALRRRTGLRLGRALFGRVHAGFGPDLRTLACGGARLDAAIAWRLEGLGWEVLTGYGLTETAPILTFTPRGHGRFDSVGRAVPGVELRIAADGGGSDGEIQARGPSVFAGYRNNPEETARAFTADGWFRTGDIGRIDRAGYLSIVGRAKEIIVLAGGKNVVPEDVEAAYQASPLIREIAIVEEDGALAALVVPDEEALRRHGASQAQVVLRDEIENVGLTLPPYQRLARYRVTRAALPRTHLGKLRRHLLAEAFAQAERGTAAAAQAELAEADRALLASATGAAIWAWLRTRHPDVPLSPDTSPQLDLGIDSLAWVTLTLELQERFGIRLTEEAIGRILTLRDLLVEAGRAPTEAPSPQAAAGEPEWLRPVGPLMAALGVVVLGLTWVAMRLLFRLRVEGADNLPKGGPYVIAPNHVSYIDPPAVAAAIPFGRLKRTYWAGWTGKMFAGTFSRLMSRATRVFPVDPDRGPAGSLEHGRAVLARGLALVWFPEGRRSPAGDIRRFLPGVGMLLRETGAPAVPVLILGAFEAWPRDRRWPRFRRITVRFGAPIPVDRLLADGSGADPAERIADALRHAVAALAGPDATRMLGPDPADGRD
ncbi:MAG: AMP-binding protein [Alphaproteobacteria bacterium]